MPNSSGGSVSSISSASAVASAPEEVIDFNTFYNNYGHDKYDGNLGWIEADPNHWWTKFANFFTGDVDKAKNLYDAYLTNVNLRNEAKATQSARAYDEYVAKNQYSWAFQGLEKAGINPYLLLNSGSLPAAGGYSSPKASYSKASMREAQSSTKGRDLALIVLAIARLAAALA